MIRAPGQAPGEPSAMSAANATRLVVSCGREETGYGRYALRGDRRTRDGTWEGVPFGAEPRRLPVPGGVHLPGPDRGGLRAPTVFLPAASQALVAAGQRAQVGRPA